MSTIKQNVYQVLSELPAGVQLVAAAKTRLPGEILEAVEAGVKIVGENYVQDAERACNVIGHRVEWHLIGHLQKNKVKRAVKIFDMIETVDSISLAVEIDKRCAQIGRVMPVLVEVNIGREKQKTGVSPEDLEKLIREISVLPYIKVVGLMTVGPSTNNPEDSRSYFREAKGLFEKMKRLNLPNVEMKHLSMGMTDTYKVALEEGANIIRLGTKIFGERDYGRG